ncbi:hypothetical protein [Jannaschia aquimarina]|uniref:Uncharacterized protein n=1 Tax=Jannaschia aquimarina TaxID=935700 RepID=A0A0D1CM59_9RHOB|nr:hypothetical protein [Jannaschia aquimarina]KIT15822.1 hypothetical protein jaqu_24020 [Jannaschia aquimarina]SNT09407.1 hypothetical protein SAMN05421775_105217 [Jannaschia aquimarina]
MMALRVLLYRLYRLRRLVLSAITLPLLLAIVIAGFAGGWTYGLLPLALLPAAHALRYPHEWSETLMVSAVLMAVIYPLGIVGTFLGPFGLIVLFCVALAGGVALFAWLTQIVPEWLNEGPAEAVTLEARTRSRLSVATLRERVLLRPGRRDARITCGAADAGGKFSVTCTFPPMRRGGFELQAAALRFRARREEDAGGWDEVRTVSDDGKDVSALRLRFRKTVLGTLIEAEEVTEPVTRGHAIGLWLVDGLADLLTDELDRAAGRPVRSIRFTVPDSLVSEIQRFVHRPRQVERTESAPMKVATSTAAAIIPEPQGMTEPMSEEERLVAEVQRRLAGEGAPA